MISRRNVFAVAAITAASLAPIGPSAAQTPPAQAPGASPGNPEFLFVQTGTTMTFDRAANRLTLHGVSPITLFFSDRPNRIAGNMLTTAFVPFWSTGRDSFLSNPPNADVSVVEGNQLQQVVVVLRDPVLQGDNLSYTVQVLEGEVPESGGLVSVFIDVIGMPRTPVSVAGATRRVYRRAVFR